MDEVLFAGLDDLVFEADGELEPDELNRGLERPAEASP